MHVYHVYMSIQCISEMNSCTHTIRVLNLTGSHFPLIMINHSVLYMANPAKGRSILKCIHQLIITHFVLSRANPSRGKDSSPGINASDKIHVQERSIPQYKSIALTRGVYRLRRGSFSPSTIINQYNRCGVQPDP